MQDGSLIVHFMRQCFFGVRWSMGCLRFLDGFKTKTHFEWDMFLFDTVVDKGARHRFITCLVVVEAIWVVISQNWASIIT